MGEEEEIPKRYWYEFKDRFSRLDELLVTLIKDLRVLIKKISVPPEIPPLGVVSLDSETIKALAQAIAVRLVQLPNRLDKIEIDTSITDWASLRKTGVLKPAVLLGFWVESIGGGFDYKIMRAGQGPTKVRTAVADDKWDQEFDDIMVKGAGAGTATIFLWWREPLITE